MPGPGSYYLNDPWHILNKRQNELNRIRFQINKKGMNFMDQIGARGSSNNDNKN